MGETTNRQWRLAAYPDGMVKESDFRLQEAPVPEPGEGEYLVRVHYLMVHPGARHGLVAGGNVAVGDLMNGYGIGEVVRSRHPDWRAGDVVVGSVGWQDYVLGGGSSRRWLARVPAGMPLPKAIGLLGPNGLTAYFGLLDVGRPTPGETVVVSGAAGAVGSVVGQIAKFQGCRAVGIAGSEAKCAWLTSELGFDAAINYRAEEVAGRLRETCPEGIHIYFDNVGGELLETALAQLAMRGRVVLCGAVSTYNVDSPPGPRNLMALVSKHGRIEGFLWAHYAARFPEAQQQLHAWLTEGRLRTTETILQGMEQVPAALVQLFAGANTGQMLVQVAGAPPASTPSS